MADPLTCTHADARIAPFGDGKVYHCEECKTFTNQVIPVVPAPPSTPQPDEGATKVALPVSLLVGSIAVLGFVFTLLLGGAQASIAVPTPQPQCQATIFGCQP